MSFRITSNSTKVGYVVASYIIALLLTIAAFFIVGFPAATVVWGILLIICVGVAVRSFRGDNESREAPRQWWRVSARPTSGFVFTGLFLLQGISLTVAAVRDDIGVGYFGLAILNLVIAVFFAHSSLRLVVPRAGVAVEHQRAEIR